MKEKWNFEKEKIERKKSKKAQNPNLEHICGKKNRILFIIYNNNIYNSFFTIFFCFLHY